MHQYSNSYAYFGNWPTVGIFSEKIGDCFSPIAGMAETIWMFTNLMKNGRLTGINLIIYLINR